MSQDFVDGKLATAHFDDLEIASKAIVDGILLQGIEFDVVGGPTLGADALTIGIAGIQRCRWFFVRKEPKGRGTNKLIEGSPIGSGDRCLVIEDAITTGVHSSKQLMQLKRQVQKLLQSQHLWIVEILQHRN